MKQIKVEDLLNIGLSERYLRAGVECSASIKPIDCCSKFSISLVLTLLCFMT